MNKPKVSVIVPIYNVEKYLDRCLDSLLNQTLQDIEIILVDDESPDNCPAMCDQYEKDHDRIKVIHKKNGGLGFARNSGLDLATGEYVAFIDSDDYVHLDMFRKLYETAKDNSLDTVYCGYNNVDQNGKVEALTEVEELTTFRSTKEINDVLLNMIATEPSNPIERKYRMSVWHAIYDRSIIEDNKIRFCSERVFISEDIIFHIDYLVKSKQIGFIPDSFYYYCFNDTSLTKSFRDDRFEKAKIIYKELLRKFREYNFEEELFKVRVDRFLIGYSRASIRSFATAQISFSRNLSLVKKVCNDPVWKELKDYPVAEMPLKHKFVYLCMKNKLYLPLTLIFKSKLV